MQTLQITSGGEHAITRQGRAVRGPRQEAVEGGQAGVLRWGLCVAGRSGSWRTLGTTLRIWTPWGGQKAGPQGFKQRRKRFIR